MVKKVAEPKEDDRRSPEFDTSQKRPELDNVDDFERSKTANVSPLQALEEVTAEVDHPFQMNPFQSLVVPEE